VQKCGYRYYPCKNAATDTPRARMGPQIFPVPPDVLLLCPDYPGNWAIPDPIAERKRAVYEVYCRIKISVSLPLSRISNALQIALYIKHSFDHGIA